MNFMGFFMRKILIVLPIVLLVLSACNNEQKEKNEKKPIKVRETEKIHDNYQTSSTQDSLMNDINVKIREDINNPELYVDRSDLYLEIGDTRSAIEDLDRAYRIDSTNLKTLMAQADLFTRGGRLDASLRILEKAKGLYPEHSDLYVRMAEVYLIGHNNSKSLESADLAVKYDIYNEKAYYLKAYNFLEMRDTAKAISSFRTAIEQNPDYYDGYLQLGLLFSTLNDPLAIDYFNNALEIKPNDKDALYSRAMFEQEHEMLNEAMQTYTQAIKAHPDFREAYYNMGYIHMFYLQLYSEALQYFTQAVEADPEYYEAYYNRGYSFELMGDIGNAAKDYQKALEIQPDYTLAAKGMERVKGAAQ